jgi:CheY-like chemotaxis protein
MSRILIIDDDEDVRAMVREVLSRAGYDTTEAANGRVGIKLQKESPADLILTDLIMPEQEGLETIMEIRRLFPKTRIVAMSGGGHDGVMDFLPMARKLGASKTLNKPFTTVQLLAAVREVLAAS